MDREFSQQDSLNWELPRAGKATNIGILCPGTQKPVLRGSPSRCNSQTHQATNPSLSVIDCRPLQNGFFSLTVLSRAGISLRIFQLVRLAFLPTVLLVNHMTLTPSFLSHTGLPLSRRAGGHPGSPAILPCINRGLYCSK